MKTDSELDAMLNRRKEIASAVEKLKAEDSEIENALRVFSRYGKLPTGSNGTGERAGKLGPPRPDGTPSLFDMTETVIKDAIKGGKSGLKGREIVAEIGKRYWPGVKPQQVLPPIYGFVKNKRLKKGDNGIFKPV
jgi:hypothetical protein